MAETKKAKSNKKAETAKKPLWTPPPPDTTDNERPY